MKKSILIVPGFVVDTYSQIEKAYVDLFAQENEEFDFFWLVPDINNADNSYANPSKKNSLREPLYVTHLKRKKAAYIIGNISKYNIFKNAFLFYRIFKKYKVAAVYTHFGFERFYATFYAKLFGVKTIWNEHWHSLGTRFVFFKRLFYVIFVDCCIAVSDFIASKMPKELTVYTVKNALEYEEQPVPTPESRSLLKKSKGIKDKDRVIIMVAAFRSEKRHDLALKVCKEVINKQKNVVFYFLGDGTLRQQFLKEVSMCGLDNNVFAPGYVYDVDSFYEIADIVMLTSVNEACPFAILEAMKMCKPVVAFDSGGTAELLKNSYSGILVPVGKTRLFAEKIEALLGDAQRCTLLGNNALQQIKLNFSKSHWKHEMFSVLYSIILEKEYAEEYE